MVKKVFQERGRIANLRFKIRDYYYGQVAKPVTFKSWRLEVAHKFGIFVKPGPEYIGEWPRCSKIESAHVSSEKGVESFETTLRKRASRRKLPSLIMHGTGR